MAIVVPIKPPGAALEPAEPTERQYQVAWASGAATVAAEIPSLPPNQRAEATVRAAVLQQCADELLAGTVPPWLRPSQVSSTPNA